MIIHNEIVINNKFDLEEMVYLKTDPEQIKRMITGIKICVDFSILYELTFSAFEASWHYEAELSGGKDLTMA